MGGKMIRCMIALAGLAAALLPLSGHAADAAPLAAEASHVAMVKNDTGLPADWHRRGVFMEILVRAYQDSNGDGIGDLNGITQRLDYLQSLGVTGLWLMPIFKSDDHDHGYAVVNYRDIEADYGTLADFDRLIAEAHKRGIGIIVDYVMNHVSSGHPFFESAYSSRKSPYADWFIFSDTHPANWTTYSGDPWREAGDRWYYAVFDSGMPDYNLRNQAVVDFHLDNLRFWLNRGVDGFRFDAVGVLFENSSVAWENQPENHVLMKKVQDLLASYGNRYMVCEAPSDPAAFSAENSCGSAFAFGIQKHIIKSIKMGRVVPDLLYNLRTLPVERMATILANHDYFAGARLFKQFNGDEKSYKLATATLMTLPGRPFIYYGEEVGLSLAEPVSQDDQSIRGPMSWSTEHAAGFTAAKDNQFRPNVENWKTHNVEVEEKQPDSLLNWYKRLIALRKAEPALSVGTFTPISKDDDQVFGFIREYQGTKILVLINYAFRDGTVEAPADFKPEQWTPLFPSDGVLKFAAEKKAPEAAPPKKTKKGKKAAKAAAPAPVAEAPKAREFELGAQQVLILKATSAQ